MQKSIQQTYFFPHSQDVVWEYLTNADLLSLWLMKNDFQPVVGHQFNFKANPMPQLNFDGIVHCTVLSINPKDKLSYTWQCGPGDKIEIDSIVEWTLVPKENGTELQLNHGNFTICENEALFMATSGGWPKQIKKLDDTLKASVHGTTNA